MKFSERHGFKTTSQVIQTDSVSEDLRNTTWNLLLHFKFDDVCFQNNSFYVDHNMNNLDENSIGQLSKVLWMFYFEKPLDKRPYQVKSVFEYMRNHFFGGEWFEFYDFLEFLLNYYKDEKLNEVINSNLEKKLSAYRFVNSVITIVSNKQEIEMLETALGDNEFPNVKSHLQRALELLSDRKNPDYRNSIKESISAVESIAKEISHKPKAELGEALKEIEKQGKLHGAMKSAFLSLYGYTSDANGIRHALMEESNLTADDAKFFLLSCTSFINYLKAKM